MGCFQDPRAILRKGSVLEDNQCAGGCSGGIAYREPNLAQTGIHRKDFQSAAARISIW
jgi:hypothetical protein